MPFSEEELERYARHILLRDVGGPGQQKLKQAKVLVVGAGGLGSPVILYLAAAGVGSHCGLSLPWEPEICRVRRPSSTN